MIILERRIETIKENIRRFDSRINVRRLLDSIAELRITPELIADVLEHRDKIRYEKITELPEVVGQIYGMYANALGLGGYAYSSNIK